MSRSLYWKPVPDVGNCLGQCVTLRKCLEQKYHTDDLDNIILRSHDDYDYLLALAHAEVEGAVELLEALEDHPEITVVCQ